MIPYRNRSSREGNFSITFKTLPNKDIIATIRAKISLTLQNSRPPKGKIYGSYKQWSISIT